MPLCHPSRHPGRSAPLAPPLATLLTEGLKIRVILLTEQVKPHSEYLCYVWQMCLNQRCVEVSSIVVADCGNCSKHGVRLVQRYYEGRFINKLQNDVILLVFKILNIRNMRFVGNLIGNMHVNFHYYDFSCIWNTISRCNIFPRSFLSHLVLSRDAKSPNPKSTPKIPRFFWKKIASSDRTVTDWALCRSRCS